MLLQGVQGCNFPCTEILALSRLGSGFFRSDKSVLRFPSSEQRLSDLFQERLEGLTRFTLNPP
jgi:hypothetical protein